MILSTAKTVHHLEGQLPDVAKREEGGSGKAWDCAAVKEMGVVNESSEEGTRWHGTCLLPVKRD